MNVSNAPARKGLHPAWIVMGAIFVALLVSAGVRAMPGVLLVPLEKDLGWDRATISFAVSVGIGLYGLMGPFAGAIMQRYGIRRTVLAAAVVMSISVATTTLAQSPWHMILTWGVLSGLATGTIANVLAATIVTRWFVTQRGLAMGILIAATSTGQLAFLPALAFLIDAWGWRSARLVVAAAALVVLPVIYLLVPETPASARTKPLGAPDDWVPPPRLAGNPLARAFTTLGRGARSPTFWVLFASFFVCGLSTNGLIGTHMVAMCFDYGIPEVQAASLLAAMGIFDLVGTTASGWLSDRYDNRVLLAWYYGLRGISLIFLPFSSFNFVELSVFAVFYGLDWIATVPPTVRLANQTFGDADGPVLFGWIAAGHQLGAATAAFGGGLLRSLYGSYMHAFIVAGLACVAVAAMMLITRMASRRPALAS